MELLNTALSRSRELRVLDTRSMARIVRDLGGDPERGVGQSIAADVARKAGVGTMLVGSIVKSGSTIRLQAKMIDVESGEIRHADHVDGRADDDIFAMVASLTEKLQTYLQISEVGENVDEAWMRALTTTSVDAYRDYIQGRRYFIQEEHARARPYFERAIAADSNFVMAYVDLVGACFNLDDLACIGEAYGHAVRLRSRASRRERLSIDLVGAIIKGEAEQQIRLATELLTIDPTARFWRYTLGRGYYRSGRHEQALSEWAPLIAAGYEWVWTYAYASDACLQLGRFDEGHRILERGFEVTPPQNENARARLHRYRGRLFREQGKTEQALADFQTCAELDPEYRPMMKYDLGVLHERQGDKETALEYYRQYLLEDSTQAFADDARARIEKLE